jgi:hypothetical protein
MNAATAEEIRRQAAEAAGAGDAAGLVAIAKSFTVYLSPMFHLIPWDDCVIVSRERFQNAYDFAANATADFSRVDSGIIAQTICDCPAALTVYRVVAGYRVQELAYVLEYKFKTKVSESPIRTIESSGGALSKKQHEQIKVIAQALSSAVEGTLLPKPGDIKGFIDRRDKFDTKHGWADVANCARNNIPYATVLYERYLGRPFAYVVDALSERKADLLESPIESLLSKHGVPHYRSKPIDKIPGFEQAPDFLVPGHDEPAAVIEAKLAEDGGTARDKASRIERLSRTTEQNGIKR